MENKDDIINKINARANVYKKQYLDNLKKEYVALEQQYMAKARQWQTTLIVNFSKRKKAHDEMKAIKLKMIDLNQRIKMIEKM